MANRILPKLLTVGPVRRTLERLHRHPAARGILERLSGISRVYTSMDEVRDAIRDRRPETCGHQDRDLIGSNFTIFSEVLVSDYPVLFWLSTIARTEPLRIFDFGGGVGQSFVGFSPLLSDGDISQWIVQDLPEVIPHDRSDCATKTATLVFTAAMEDGADSNVVFAAGSLHYWEGTMNEFFRQIGASPRHFIVNRSPIRVRGDTFYTAQEGDDWAVPCKVRSLAALKAEMETEGYMMIDSWVIAEKRLPMPWLPSFACQYRGAYFRRDG